VLKTLRHVPADTHIVWNTNLWSTPEAIDRLRPLIGTWLVDHKFGNDACGLRLGGVRAYDTTFRPLFDHLARAAERTATGGTQPFIFIRHLLMPGHFTCCTEPVLSWLATHHPAIPVNLMTGYHPYRMARANNPMARRIPPPEVAAAIAWFSELPLLHPHLDGLPLARGE
jgi:putative pyruvate formate lyase activating enzyme